MNAKTTDFFIAAVGEVSNAADLNRIIRRCNRQLKSLTPAPPAATGLNKADLKVDDVIVIGTPQGEHTKAQVLVVNRKRVRVKLLAKRGTRKPVKKGTVIDVYPDMVRGRA